MSFQKTLSQREFLTASWRIKKLFTTSINYNDNGYAKNTSNKQELQIE